MSDRIIIVKSCADCPYVEDNGYGRYSCTHKGSKGNIRKYFDAETFPPKCPLKEASMKGTLRVKLYHGISNSAYWHYQIIGIDGSSIYSSGFCETMQIAKNRAQKRLNPYGMTAEFVKATNTDPE